MEDLKSLGIGIAILVVTFSLVTLASFIYCIYMNYRTFEKPSSSVNDKESVIIEPSGCYSNHGQPAVSEKYDRNMGMASSPIFV